MNHKQEKYRFSFMLAMAITILVVAFFPQISKLTIYTQTQKKHLLQNISRNLEITAIEQARIVDPNYEWIRYVDDLSPEIQNALKEDALSSQLNSGNSLTNDSNLIWEVSYKGKSFFHNYPENLNLDDIMLDITFSSDGNRAFVSSSTVLPSLALFNVQTRGIVNPNLVNSEVAGSNEFYYNVVLPKDFTIRFMVPEHLQANGGIIAQQASYLEEGRFVFFMGVSVFICMLIVLIANIKLEKKSWLFSRMIRIKALFVWIGLPLAIFLLTGTVYMVTTALVSGVLNEFFRSLGFSVLQSRISANLTGFVIWWVWLYCSSLGILYIKYIFRCGFRRYLLEDTLTASLLKKAEISLTEQSSKPLERWVLRKVISIYVIVILFVIISCFITYHLFGPVPVFLLFTAECIAIGVLIYRMLYLMRSDYESTLAAANELIAGNFSYIQPKSAGMYQSLYNSLVDVKNEFQKALRDGLHSQNMKTQLISNVSHDLKTPVTGIKSYAELIGMSDNIEDIHNYAHHLDNYTNRLSRLITDLFDVARASSGDIQLTTARIDLSALMEQVAMEWDEEFEKKEMKLILKLQPECMVVVDPDKTVRMIENLFSNIRKYGLSKTRIFVSTICESDEVILKIKNVSKTALDFSPEEITERFVRGDKSRHEPGAGLGLAIVKSFAEVQNGSFTIDIDGDIFTAILAFPKSEKEKSSENDLGSNDEAGNIQGQDQPGLSSKGTVGKAVDKILHTVKAAVKTEIQSKQELDSEESHTMDLPEPASTVHLDLSKPTLPDGSLPSVNSETSAGSETE